MTDGQIFANLALALWATGLGGLGWLLYRRLRRSRPNLGVGFPLALGSLVRVAVAAAVSLTSYAPTLRGPDERTWLENATSVTADGAFEGAGLAALKGSLHVWLIGVQNMVGPVPELCLRMTMVALAMGGILFIVAAIYDLAGVRAARLGAWLLAFEPSGVFFSGVLLKEPVLLFAGGLAVFGGSKIWQHGGLKGVPVMVIAGAIAVSTRPYAGWFLVTACALITFHATLRHAPRRPNGFIVAIGMTFILLAMVPVLASISSQDSLKRLQASQEANTSDESNLKLAPVDFSTREKVARNLPTRVVDVLFRPYPWQVSNLSQQLGALGSLFALAVFYLLAQAIFRTRGRALLVAGPFAYIGVALLIAYALSAGNAGTSFRYRTHLVAFSLGGLVVLRELGRTQRRVVFHNWQRPPTVPAHARLRSTIS